MSNKFKQVSDERYEIIVGRYKKFQDSMGSGTEPEKVFDPLKQFQLDELELIRQVSKDLQKKKQEDINKAAFELLGDYAKKGYDRREKKSFANKQAEVEAKKEIKEEVAAVEAMKEDA